MNKIIFILVLIIGSGLQLHSQCCDTSRCVVPGFDIYIKGEKFRKSYCTSSRYCNNQQPYPLNLFDSLGVIPVHSAINKACKITFFEPQTISLYIEKNIENSYWQITSTHKISGKSAMANVKYKTAKLNAKTGKILKVKTINTKAITHPFR